jgi:xanthine/CO dehydrogenase XdhC/CoxF family maturation factor
VAAEWDHAVEALTFSARTAVVLMTHDLDDDAQLLTRLPARTLPYIGALGPAHRREWLLEQTASLDVAGTGMPWLELRGPIGLDLGDRSPAGIAVAVVAEVLAVLNRREPRSLSTTGACDALAWEVASVCA